MAKKKTAPKKTASAKTVKVSTPISPLSDRVVVRPLTDSERGTATMSGIIIPEAAQEKAMEGIVVAVGPGRYENGSLLPMQVMVGDKVMFGKYGHEEVKVNGQEYFIVSESNVLAIIN